ncbi:hypothetical protein NC652_028144 [Populus alba x Populus x berolinensis]|nr:hypothetical protein NC652_028144 [Populus alba x Populus x berolinensis]
MIKTSDEQPLAHQVQIHTLAIPASLRWWCQLRAAVWLCAVTVLGHHRAQRYSGHVVYCVRYSRHVVHGVVHDRKINTFLVVVDRSTPLNS